MQKVVEPTKTCDETSALPKLPTDQGHDVKVAQTSLAIAVTLDSLSFKDSFAASKILSLYGSNASRINVFEFGRVDIERKIFSPVIGTFENFLSFKQASLHSKRFSVTLIFLK